MHDRDALAEPGTWQSALAKRGWVRATPLISALAGSVILAVLVQVYAGATLRGMYADGASFTTQLAAQQCLGWHYHSACISEPPRMMSTLINQGPVIVAMRLGVQTPHSVALVFSLVTNLLPGLIIVLCLPALPAGKRHFFIFPAFVYFAGTLGAQFASVAEGLVATSYFWLLLCLIAFGRLTVLRLALVAVLAVGTMGLHEQMLLLGANLGRELRHALAERAAPSAAHRALAGGCLLPCQYGDRCALRTQSG